MFEVIGIFCTAGWCLATALQLSQFAADRYNRRGMCEEILNYVRSCQHEVTHCRQECAWWLIPVPFSYPKAVYLIGHAGVWVPLPPDLPIGDAARVAATALEAMQQFCNPGDLDFDGLRRYPEED